MEVKDSRRCGFGHASLAVFIGCEVSSVRESLEGRLVLEEKRPFRFEWDLQSADLCSSQEDFVGTA